MSREQSRAMRAVEASFPPELQSIMPRYRPKVLRDTVLDALRWRTAEQLAERVQRRWYTWDFARLAEAGQLERPVGVAVKLVGDGDCGAARCEDGVDIDTGKPCPRCEERAASRRQARRVPRGPVPDQRSAPDHRTGVTPRPQSMWECAVPECRRPGKGKPPADMLCEDCRGDAAQAAAATQKLSENLARAEAPPAAESAGRQEQLLEDAHAERAQREQQAPGLRFRTAEQQGDPETYQLREEMARQHPDLIAFSSARSEAGTAPTTREGR
ncbi:hypothetical protein ACXZ65_39420 [Streptomyces aculeolatus]